MPKLGCRRVIDKDLASADEVIRAAYLQQIKDALRTCNYHHSHKKLDALAARLLAGQPGIGRNVGGDYAECKLQRVVSNAQKGIQQLNDRAFLFLSAPSSNVPSGNDVDAPLTLEEEKDLRALQFKHFAKRYPGLKDDPDKNPQIEADVYNFEEIRQLLDSFFHNIGGNAKVPIIIFNGHGKKCGGLHLQNEAKAIRTEDFLTVICECLTKCGLHSPRSSYVASTPVRVHPVKVQVILAQCYSHLFSRGPEIHSILDIKPLASSENPETHYEWDCEMKQVDSDVQRRVITVGVHQELTKHARKMSKRAKALADGEAGGGGGGSVDMPEMLEDGSTETLGSLRSSECSSGSSQIIGEDISQHARPSDCEDITTLDIEGSETETLLDSDICQNNEVAMSLEDKESETEDDVNPVLDPEEETVSSPVQSPADNGETPGSTPAMDTGVASTIENEIIMSKFLEKSIYSNQGYTASSSENSGSEIDVMPAGNWRGKWDFLLACLSYTVGLGNLWRFPYLCYKNGGGTFLVSYVLMLMVVGVPMMFLEMTIGQYFSPVRIWNICPIFKGIGYAMLSLAWISTAYLIIVNAYTALFLFTSLAATLPWAAVCDSPWDNLNGTERVNSCQISSNGSTNSSEWLMNTSLNGNETVGINMINVRSPGLSAAEEYFNQFILQRSDSVSLVRSMSWQLSLTVLFACLVVLIASQRACRGKTALYFTATFPYLMLIVMLVRGVTLPGAAQGLMYFVKIDWSKLLHAQIWVQATGCVLLSHGVGLGEIIYYSSYNRFHNNIHRHTFSALSELFMDVNCRDCGIISIVGLLTSVLGAVTVFVVAGHMAHMMKTSVEEVTTDGPGLVFVVYATLAQLFPMVQPLWSALFFFMLFVAGIGTQVGLGQMVTLRLREKFSYPGVLVSVSVIASGLALTLQNGLYLLQLIDVTMAGLPVIVVALMEAVVIGWIYGSTRWAVNVKEMLGRRPSHAATLWCRLITPTVLLGCVALGFADPGLPHLDNYEYPSWALWIKWILITCPFAIVIAYAVIVICHSSQKPPSTGVTIGWLAHSCLALARPKPDWGPCDRDGVVTRTNISQEALAV